MAEIVVLFVGVIILWGLVSLIRAIARSRSTTPFARDVVKSVVANASAARLERERHAARATQSKTPKGVGKSAAQPARKKQVIRMVPTDLPSDPPKA